MKPVSAIASPFSVIASLMSVEKYKLLSLKYHIRLHATGRGQLRRGCTGIRRDCYHGEISASELHRRSCTSLPHTGHWLTAAPGRQWNLAGTGPVTASADLQSLAESAQLPQARGEKIPI